MQATAGLSGVLAVKGRAAPSPRRSMAGVTRMRAQAGRVRATAEEVDYNSSSISVFPVEACDLVGGEACDAHMYPEAKLRAAEAQAPQHDAAARPAAEEVEREYLAYDDPKTVFPGEACDDLGGEFCEAPYQAGVSN